MWFHGTLPAIFLIVWTTVTSSVNGATLRSRAPTPLYSIPPSVADYVARSKEYIDPRDIGVGSPVAISPGQPLEPDHDSDLEKRLWRYHYTGLWNGSTPRMEDPAQNIVYNCWLPAATIAIAAVAPEWVAHLLAYPDGTPMYGQTSPQSVYAQVTLWNTDTREPLNFTVNVFNETTTEDHSGGLWWPSAVSQAMLKLGSMIDVYGIHRNGTFWHNSGIPSVALAMMTGRDITTKPNSEFASIDEWMAIVEKAKETPVVVSTSFQTSDTTTMKIWPNHGYAVLNTTLQGDGSKMIYVRNPWGRTENFTPKDLFANTFYINHLRDFNKLEWKGAWPGRQE